MKDHNNKIKIHLQILLYIRGQTYITSLWVTIELPLPPPGEICNQTLNSNVISHHNVILHYNVISHHHNNMVQLYIFFSL